VSTYVSLLVSGLFSVPDYLFVEGKTPIWISQISDLVLFSFAGIPMAIGFAVLKYPLYDIDIISTAPSSTMS
jgi:NADH:ubiquinone oxidoreductase subunit 2 (subunit N)